ncbi:unnamed protein product, partial [Allacma fusca]
GKSSVAHSVVLLGESARLALLVQRVLGVATGAGNLNPDETEA